LRGSPLTTSEPTTRRRSPSAKCALGDAPIYKGIRNDFDIKVFGRDDLEGTV
jgi:hypothetical protein